MTSFFNRKGPFALSDLLQRAGIEAEAKAIQIADIRTLEEAGEGHLTFFENRKYLEAMQSTKAAACFVLERDAATLPATTVAVIVKEPYLAFAKALAVFYPDALHPSALYEAKTTQAGSIHSTAQVHPSAHVETGAVIGANVKVGAKTVIAANSVIAKDVEIGESSYIGAGVVVQHSLIGHRVILHPGVKIGQDGFGYAFVKTGFIKVPQVGRVIIEDDVEIGANSTVDRGALRDTVIGQGTKIDNLVQIGHNCRIGRNCIIVGQVGISGSVTLKDFVMIGGQSSVAGHVTIGEGAQIAAVSTVKDDVPAGGRYGGVPAKPIREWFREMAALSRLANTAKDNS